MANFGVIPAPPPGGRHITTSVIGDAESEIEPLAGAAERELLPVQRVTTKARFGGNVGGACSLPGNNVDDAAQRGGTVLNRGRSADDFDLFDV